MEQFITGTIEMRPPDDEIAAQELVQEQPLQEDCATPEMMPLGDQSPLEFFTLDSVRAAAAGHAVLAHILPVLEGKHATTAMGNIIPAAYDDSPVSMIRGTPKLVPAKGEPTQVDGDAA